jgi:hypothetical protein
VLDLSYNKLGNQVSDETKCGRRILDSLTRIGVEIKHLDMSFNLFTFEES